MEWNNSMLIVTGLAAALLGIQYFRLSLKVIGYRHQFKVSVGDGGQELLTRAIRSQANLTEYSPIALILLACFEWNGAPWWLSLPLATAFVTGRFLHPLGMATAKTSTKLRVAGMHLTLWTILGLAIGNILLLGWRLSGS